MKNPLQILYCVLILKCGILRNDYTTEKLILIIIVLLNKTWHFVPVSPSINWGYWTRLSWSSGLRIWGWASSLAWTRVQKGEHCDLGGRFLTGQSVRELTQTQTLTLCSPAVWGGRHPRDPRWQSLRFVVTQKDEVIENLEIPVAEQG